MVLRIWSCKIYLRLRQKKKNIQAGENCIMTSFLVCATCQILLWSSNQWEGYKKGMWHAWQRREMLEHVWLKNLKEPLGRPRHTWEDNNKMILQKQEGRAWTPLVCLRIGKSGGLLQKWQWTIMFHTVWGNFLTWSLCRTNKLTG